MRGLAGPLSEEQREFVASIRQWATMTSGFISNLIVIMSLDMGHLRSDHQAIDLKSAIETALAPLQDQITAKGLSLAVELDKNLPLALGDREMVRRALYPLLDNAWRYTEAGGIVIRAAAHAGSVQVEIEDTGRGIIPELQAYFAQPITPGGVYSWVCNFSSATGIHRGGTGLGLAVCKGLIALQGGTVWATSALGQGSRFCFTLPIAQEA